MITDLCFNFQVDQINLYKIILIINLVFKTKFYKYNHIIFKFKQINKTVFQIKFPQFNNKNLNFTNLKILRFINFYKINIIILKFLIS